MASHKQALANHACVCSSLKAMTASVHEAEVLLNAAPIVADPDDQDVRKTCLPDDDPRVEAIGEREREREGDRVIVFLPVGVFPFARSIPVCVSREAATRDDSFEPWFTAGESCVRFS